MSDRTLPFLHAIVERFPKLGALFAEHTDYYGEVLPHVFFGDVTRYAIALVLAAGDDDSPQIRELRNLLTYLEETFAEGDDSLQELISVSFLENLPRPGEPGERIRNMLGPSLKEELDAID